MISFISQQYQNCLLKNPPNCFPVWLLLSCYSVMLFWLTIIVCHSTLQKRQVRNITYKREKQKNIGFEPPEALQKIMKRQNNVKLKQSIFASANFQCQKAQTPLFLLLHHFYPVVWKAQTSRTYFPRKKSSFHPEVFPIFLYVLQRHGYSFNAL